MVMVLYRKLNFVDNIVDHNRYRHTGFDGGQKLLHSLHAGV